MGFDRDARPRGWPRCSSGSTRSAAGPSDGEGWLHHREMTDDGPKLCRSENLIPFHDGLRALLTERADARRPRRRCSASRRCSTRRRSTTSCPAAPGTRRTRTRRRTRSSTNHVSCMVAIDDATLDNGCLEVVSGEHHEVLPIDERGCIARRRRGVARVGAGGGPRRPDAVVPLAHAAPQRAEPLGRRAPGAVPDLQRARRGRPARGVLPRRSSASFAEGGRAGRPRAGVAHRRLPGPRRCHVSRASRSTRSLALYERWGDDRYDEELSQLDHALQTAALAVADRRGRRAGGRRAAARRRPPARAAGRRRGPDGRTTDRHESRGARYLAGLFPPAVTGPIALHVRAKRYLCAVDPAYSDGLSAGSTAQPRACRAAPMSSRRS